MKESQLHPYQQHGKIHLLENAGAGLFLDMGLGKTVTTLSAVNDLIYDLFEIKKVLVIAPKKVAESTWQDEAKNWEHLQHLTFSEILGDCQKRERAIKAKADIYLINRENVAWLVGLLGSSWDFDMVVIDELSSFKNPSSIRFKALRKVRPLSKRVVGLTGTPSPNGLIDLWSQVFLLDMGERLGKNITGYRKEYFNEGKRNGPVVFNYEIRKDSSDKIRDKIQDICISMKAEDYLQLPERMDIIHKVALNREETDLYATFERELIVGIGEQEITALNAASLMGKLLQFANGAIYDEGKNVHEIHSAKLDALEEIVEVANEPVIIFYRFKHDLSRIMARLKSYKPRVLKTPQDQIDWNNGDVKVLLAHPASAGYGLNLQHGGNIIIWFGETWSLELYMQANARLHRQGQQKSVIVHHLVTQGTVDEDVVKSLERKEETQEILMQAIKAKILKYAK